MAKWQKYKAADGKVVPSVTTLTKNLGWGTNGLVYWANTQGLAGVTLQDARGKADTGTVAHALIEADISGETVDVAQIAPAVLRVALKILERWKAWRALHVDTVLLSERPMVSELLRYGGRLDMVFLGTNGQTWLLDVKTGGVYPDHLVQIAGYAMLVEECTDLRIDEVAILRIPQDSESIATHEFPWDRDGDAPRAFRMCVELHRIQSVLKKAV
jgi:hypothetical protein